MFVFFFLLFGSIINSRGSAAQPREEAKSLLWDNSEPFCSGKLLLIRWCEGTDCTQFCSSHQSWLNVRKAAESVGLVDVMSKESRAFYPFWTWPFTFLRWLCRNCEMMVSDMEKQQTECKQTECKPQEEKGSFIAIKSFRITPLCCFTFPFLCVRHNIVFNIVRVTRMKEWNVHREQFVSAWMETWKLHLLSSDKHTNRPWGHIHPGLRGTHTRADSSSGCVRVCVCLLPWAFGSVITFTPVNKSDQSAEWTKTQKCKSHFIEAGRSASPDHQNLLTGSF